MKIKIQLADFFGILIVDVILFAKQGIKGLKLFLGSIKCREASGFDLKQEAHLQQTGQ